MFFQAQRVVEIPELLVLILAALHPADTLKAQRVCKEWKHLITFNINLQRRLHFSPMRPASTAGFSLIYSPLLKSAFAPFFDEQASSEASLQTDEADQADESDDDDESYIYKDTWLSKMPWTTSDTKTAAFLRADASWRNMLVRQPPPRKLVVHERHARRGGAETQCRSIEFNDKQALTMGLLYDIVEEFLMGGPMTRTFKIDWNFNAIRRESEDALRLSGPDCVDINLHWIVDCRQSGLSPDRAKYRSQACDEPKPRWMYAINEEHSTNHGCILRGDDLEKPIDDHK